MNWSVYVLVCKCIGVPKYLVLCICSGRCIYGVNVMKSVFVCACGVCGGICAVVYMLVVVSG